MTDQPYTDKDKDIITQIVHLTRIRNQWVKAKTKLSLQGQAICRGLCDGDKGKASKLWIKVLKGEHIEPALFPFVEAYKVFESDQIAYEARYKKLTKDLSIMEWVKDAKGFGVGNFCLIVGALADRPANYKSVSALWKRMGLAVMYGQRQRRIAGDAELAIEHGYSAERRALAYILGTTLIKVGDKNRYRPIYDKRKAKMLAQGKTKAHAHNDAMRIMVKQALKDLWVADRRDCGMSLSEAWQPDALKQVEPEIKRAA